MEGLISGVHAGSSTSHPCNQSHIKTNSASLREVVFVHFYTTVQLLKMKVTFQQSTLAHPSRYVAVLPDIKAVLFTRAVCDTAARYGLLCICDTQQL